MGFQNGNDFTGTIYTYLMGGVDECGTVRPIAVNSDGSMKTSMTTEGDTTKGRKVLFRKVSSDYTLTNHDDFLAVDCTNGAVSITLPSAVNPGNIVYPIATPIYEIKKIDNTSNPVTVLTLNSETIDNASNFTLNNPHEAVNLISDGYSWMIY